MPAALNVARAVAVRRQLEAEAAFLMKEVAVGPVPDSKVAICVCPELVIGKVIGRARRRPFSKMYQDDACQFGGHGKHQEVHRDQPQDRNCLLETGASRGNDCGVGLHSSLR